MRWSTVQNCISSNRAHLSKISKGWRNIENTETYALQAGGHWFESGSAHHILSCISIKTGDEKGIIFRQAPEAEAAVRCMDKNLAECLRYFDFDQSIWKSIRTTNILERAFREVRRRTRPMNQFPNADSANRIFYGVTKNLNQNWNENPVGEFPQSD